MTDLKFLHAVEERRDDGKHFMTHYFEPVGDGAAVCVVIDPSIDELDVDASAVPSDVKKMYEAQTGREVVDR